MSARASVDLPLPDRPVKNSTRPCSSGSGRSKRDDRGDLAGELAALRQAQHRVAVGVVRDHRDAQAVVGVRVAVRGERDRDHGGVGQVRGGGEGRPDQRRRRQLGRAGPDQREQHDRADVGQLGQLLVGERVDDGDERAAGVLLTSLSRREVEATEGAELRVGQRSDGAVGHGDAGEGQALGVDQLHGLGLGEGPGQVQGDRAARLVEPGGRREGPADEELEVVELARGRAVLRRGRGRHGGHPAIGLVRLRGMPTPVVVAEIVRSGFVEGHHYGSVVALDRRRPVDWSVGAVDAPMLPRSCNKPLQALGMVRLGLDLPPDLLALACASHSGEVFHVEGVRRILASAGLDESALQTPADYPLDDAAREQVIRDGGAKAPILMNCSGKHAAMLATCVINGWDLATYRDPDHPLQQAIARDLRGPDRGAGRARSRSTAAARRCCRPRSWGWPGRSGALAVGDRRARSAADRRRDPQPPGVRLGHRA